MMTIIITITANIKKCFSSFFLTGAVCFKKNILSNVLICKYNLS